MPNLNFAGALLEEGGEEDCGLANKVDAYEQKEVSLRRQRFNQPCLVLATPI